MKRPAWVWLSGPAVGVVVMAAIAIAARLTGTSSPAVTFFAPFIAMPIAWMAWWPFLRPKYGFWLHTGIGFVSAMLALAVRVVLTRTPPI